MSNLSSPQTISLILSLLGVLILLACLALIATKRIPEQKLQTIRGLGLDLNVSLITLLVLVGLILALTSTYLQIRNYDERLSQAERKANNLETALARAGKINVHAVINLKGINKSDEMPKLPVSCQYYIKSPDFEGWVPNAKVTPGIYSLDLILTMEDISPTSSIERIQITDQTSHKTWGLDHVGFVLSAPRFTLEPAN